MRTVYLPSSPNNVLTLILKLSISLMYVVSKSWVDWQILSSPSPKRASPNCVFVRIIAHQTYLLSYHFRFCSKGVPLSMTEIARLCRTSVHFIAYQMVPNYWQAKTTLYPYRKESGCWSSSLTRCGESKVCSYQTSRITHHLWRKQPDCESNLWTSHQIFFVSRRFNKVLIAINIAILFFSYPTLLKSHPSLSFHLRTSFLPTTSTTPYFFEEVHPRGLDTLCLSSISIPPIFLISLHWGETKRVSCKILIHKTHTKPGSKCKVYVWCQNEHSFILSLLASDIQGRFLQAVTFVSPIALAFLANTSLLPKELSPLSPMA